MGNRYTLSVEPDVEHELSDAEVRDLRAFGIQVAQVGGRKNTSSGSGSAPAENKEG